MGWWGTLRGWLGKGGGGARVSVDLRGLEAIINTALSGVVTIDAGKRIVSANPSALAMFGLTSAEMVGQPITCLVPTRYIESCARRADLLLAARPMGSLRMPGTYVARRKSGGEFPVEVAVADIEVGGRRMVTLIIRDKSREADAERRVEEEALRTAAILDSIPDPVFVKDTSGRYLQANEAAARALRHARGDLIGKQDAEVMEAADAARVTAYDEKVRAGEVVRYEETFLSDADARHYETSKYPLRSADGRVTGIFGIARDITDIRRTAEALRRSEESLHLALCGAGASPWSWDARTNTVIWTAEGFALFGIPPQDGGLTFEHWMACLVEEDRARVSESVSRATSAGEPDFRYEYRVRLPRGEVRWITTLGRYSYGEDGPLGAAGISFDTTERKVMEQELREAKEGAERAAAAKARFLAAASHDLRQPIQGLYMFAASLRGEVSGPEAADNLGHLERAIDSLKALLDGLLDVSRLDAGILEPEARDFCLSDLLDEVRASYAQVAAAKGVAFEVECDGANVRSDPTLVGRMLRNLVENAVRYTPSGSVTVRCRREGGVVAVEVADTGIGIPADQMDHIWDEFHQVGNPERDRENGLGLGLAIVRRLSALLGHPVSVTSAPGSGSTFTVALPAAGRASPERREAPPRPGGDRLALVVDDDRMVLMSLRAFLNKAGYAVILAESGAAAVEAAVTAGRLPDLMIADYRLRGGETGIMAVQAVRSATGVALPAIILTGETATEPIEDAVSNGFPVLHKPIDTDRLVASLSRLTGRR